MRNRRFAYKSRLPSFRRPSLRVFLGTIYRRAGHRSEFYISIKRPFVLNTFRSSRVSGIRGELKSSGNGTIRGLEENRLPVICDVLPHYVRPRRQITFIRQSVAGPIARDDCYAKHSTLMTFAVRRVSRISPLDHD